MDSVVSADAVKKQVKTYIGVFVALLFLTVVTVAVSYLHLSMPAAIGVAMLVASVKGSLVALYFMHLNHEKKIIYWTLAITVFMFFVVMAIAFSV